MTIRYSTGTRNALASATGFSSTFNNGVIEIRTGSQPADADSPVTGTLLGTVTLNSGAFTPGTATNGLTWTAPTAGTVGRSGTWSFTGIAAGTAGWFRLKANAVDAGAQSATAVRVDGSIAAFGADLSISNVNIAVNAPNTVDDFTFTVPSA